MKNIKLTLILFLSLVISSLSLVNPTYALITNPVIKNPTAQASNPKAYFNSVLATVVSIFFIVGVVYFIWHIVFAGYHLIASEGDPKRWESSKNELVYAAVGLFVIFSIFAILKFVGIVLGLPGLGTLQMVWPSL